MMIGSSSVRNRSRLQRLALAAVVIATAAGSLPAVADEGRVAKRDSAIAFSNDLDGALDLAKATDKPVFLAFGAVWCPVCRQLEDKTMLEQPLQALAGDFVWVKIDVDRNMTLAREWGVEATPTVFLLDPAGGRRHEIVGGASADELAALLQAFLDELGGAEPEAADAGGGVIFERTQLTMTPQGYRGKSICFSHVGYGPIVMRSQSPFQALRLGIVPRTPSTLARGEHQLRAEFTWANTWTNNQATFDPANGDLGEFLLDFESLDASLSYAYGMSDTLQIELEYEQRWRFGGVLDGFIEGFHDLFGLGQAGRDEFPRDQTNIFVAEREGSPEVSLLGDDASGTFAREFLLTVQHNVTCGTSKWPALSWSATVRSSLGNPGDLEGGSVDVALSVAAARRFGRFYTYLTLGYARYGSDAVYGIELEQTQASVLAAGEWRFSPRMSLVLQYLGTQGVATDLGVFSDPSHEVVLGWKWEARKAGVLEVGLIENIIEFGNSPDFGVHAGWTQRF
jgi:thiol-disulfide isomerase/thioredoxin